MWKPLKPFATFKRAKKSKRDENALAPPRSRVGFSDDWTRNDMPRGGKRHGAGRKPGPQRDGGNRALAKATVTKVLTAERDPLFVLVDLAFDVDQDVHVRKEAAIAALPYIHPRLSAVVTANVQQPVAADQNALTAKLLGRIAKIEAARLPVIDADGQAEAA